MIKHSAMATPDPSINTKNQTTPICFHCGEPVANPSLFTSVINGQKEPMCCAGCKAVADLIIESGMASFYTQRTHYAETAPEFLLDLDYDSYDFSELKAENEQSNDTKTHKIQLLVGGMTCAACSWLVERQALRTEGVKAARVSLSESTLNAEVDTDTPITVLMQSIAKLGYRVQPFQSSERTKLLAQENKLMLKRLAVAGLGMMQVGMFAIALHAGAIQGMEIEYQQLMRWVSLPIALFVTIYSGAGFFRSAWSHLKHGAVVMDLSISLALGLALSASIYATLTASGEVYFDSVVMFVFFLLVARYFEHRSRFASSLSLQKIQDTLPRVANRLVDSTIKRCSIKDLQYNDRIRVFAGDIIPLDGLVASGDSDIDESTFTGESVPRAVKTGDQVFAGTLNLKQTIDLEITSDPDSTKLKALENAINYAETQKPKIAKLADRIAGVFILGVLIIASTTAFYWWQHQPQNAFWIALSVLVVSCPCALGLATPAALTAAAQTLRQLGAIIRGDNAIEQLSDIDTVIFDKTGTLTDGNFECVKTLTFGNLTATDCFILAQALQAHSDHPIASAFGGSIAFDEVDETLKKPINALLEPGFDQRPQHEAQGLKFEHQGHRFQMGNAEFLSKANLPSSWPMEALHWIGLSIDNNVVALFGLQDQLRPDAKDLVNYYKDAGVRTVLLTGDASLHAHSLATELPFDECVFGLNPQQKLAHLSRMQNLGRSVLMVGDGVNDAAVLAQANVGIAVSQATDLARAKADIVITDSDLEPVKLAHLLALRARRVIKQNLMWALGYNIVAIPLACLGHIPPWLAALGMSLSSLIVVFNSLRLKNHFMA
jgi:Cu2+-exporting ATPase